MGAFYVLQSIPRALGAQAAMAETPMKKILALLCGFHLAACDDMSIASQRGFVNRCIDIGNKRLLLAETLGGYLEQIQSQGGADDSGLIRRSLSAVDYELDRVKECSQSAREKYGNDFDTFVYINYYVHLTLLSNAYHDYDNSERAVTKEAVEQRVRELITVLMTREEWGAG